VKKLSPLNHGPHRACSSSCEDTCANVLQIDSDSKVLQIDSVAKVLQIDSVSKVLQKDIVSKVLQIDSVAKVLQIDRCKETVLALIAHQLINCLHFMKDITVPYIGLGWGM
jgi:hypothetical protein